MQAASASDGRCITLIGMPGVGKSTIGQELARHLDWGLVDADHLMEATYGVPLQRIADALDKEAFLDVEATEILALRMRRVIIATGGSVVYRHNAMTHLASLGPIVHLDAPLELIQKRIARNPERGLAIAPGQTIEDLFRERQSLYGRYARCAVDVSTLPPADCAEAVLRALEWES